MRATPRRYGSLLLQHIHRSLPVLQRLYSNAATEDPPTRPRTVSQLPAFPPDPQTSEDGDAVLRFFCAELGMGEAPLRLWRQRLLQKRQRRWRLEEALVGGREKDGELPWTAVRVQPSSSSTSSWKPASPPSPTTLWLRPRPQDAAVVQSALRDLKFLVSPLLLLAPPPHLSAPSANAASGSTPPRSLQGPASTRPTTYEECSRWYATQAIPAGMFLMSIPTEAVLFANPPPASDPLLTFFMQVEELVAQLVDAATSPEAAHHGYARYLCESVVPCRNLPFLQAQELRQMFAAGELSESAKTHRESTGSVVRVPQQESKGNTTTNTSAPVALSAPSDVEAAGTDSPAISLVSFFHEDMAAEPLSDFLRSRLTKDEYAWWVSLVLAHRAGSSSLLPMIDKLNHSPLPNCYYTMATEETMCGLDVFDNLLAGVPGELLYQPYVHVFAMRDVAAGEELTLCYASAAESAYRPAGRHVPPRPATLPPPPTVGYAAEASPENDDEGERDGNAHCSTEAATPRMRLPEPAEMSEVMASLFSSRGDVAAAAAASGLPHGAADLTRQLHQLRHAGKQEVSTAEGRASWMLQWGFVPPCDAVYSARDLMEVAALVAERRVDTRTAVFPPSASSSS